MSEQLVRSKKNQVIGGVCGGIAEYLHIDPIIVRLLWVFFTLTWGAGIIAYIICMIFIPESTSSYVGENYSTGKGIDIQKNRSLIGAILIGLGVILFAKRYLHWLNSGTIGAVLLVAAGVYIIYQGKGEK